MSIITQNGNDNQANTGDNSIISKDSRINVTNFQKAGWFLGGVILPIIVALVTDYMKKGKVSEVINILLSLFQ